ncbi:EG45-like domain containing protein [Tripterygium wilfordii]|uniref:EG45-like domain containing protein n=1 Tax=Tripterygium wilfordii TaxID=458696 RepID=UPI0018F7FB9D|nr:EG45-like domain containing protein [Tripterygium wilfordii]
MSSRSTIFVLTLLVVFSMSLFSLASAISASVQYFKPPATFEGCPDVFHWGPRYAKVSDTHMLWRNGEACGKHYKVTCTAKVDRGASPCIEGDPSIIVTVAGRCRDCPADILMSENSFAKLANKKITHNLKFDLEEVHHH